MFDKKTVTLKLVPGTMGLAHNVAELVGADKIRPTGWLSPVYADGLCLADAQSAKELIEEALAANPDFGPLTITIEE